MFALVEDKIRSLQRMNTAVVLRQVSSFEDDRPIFCTHAAVSRHAFAAARCCLHWSRTTALTMIIPLTISW